MNILKINPWYICGILAAAVCLLLVWNASIRRHIVEEQVKISQLERELAITHEKETNKTKTTTKTTQKPDGTVITETTKEEKSTKVSDEITDKDKVTTVESSKKEVTHDRTRYSIGIYSDRDRDISATLGAGLGDLPVEAVLLGTDNLKSLSVGVQFRW